MRNNTPVNKIRLFIFTTFGICLLSSSFGTTLTAQVEVTQTVSGKNNKAVQIVSANKSNKKTITEWRETFLNLEERGDVVFKGAPPITFQQNLDEADLIVKQFEALEDMVGQDKQVKKAKKKKSQRLKELNKEMEEMLKE